MSASGAIPTNKLAIKSLTRPDEVRSFPKGRMELVSIGHMTFGRATLEPGWKWSESVKPIAKTASCQISHLGCQISGRMRLLMDDGTERELGPGDVCSIPAGHDAWVVGNEPVVFIDIAGAADYAKR